MAGAYTTLKLSPGDHQTLQVLLKFLAGKVSEGEFRAVLSSQGRFTRIPGEVPMEKIVSLTAESLIGTVA